MACCVKIPKDENHQIPDGILYVFFKDWYAPALLTDWVRTIVVSVRTFLTVTSSAAWDRKCQFSKGNILSGLIAYDANLWCL